MAPIRIFLHESGENISGYLKTPDPLYDFEIRNYENYESKVKDLALSTIFISFVIFSCSSTSSGASANS